jgi:hypothetical protein
MIPTQLRWDGHTGLWVLVILLGGTVSCQRPARLTGPSADSSFTERSTAAQEDGTGGVGQSFVSDPKGPHHYSDPRMAQEQQPNWIGDPRYVREKKSSHTISHSYSGSGTEKGRPPGTTSDATGGGVTAGSSGDSSLSRPPRPLTTYAPSGPVRPTSSARPPVTQADMQEVWIYMENASAVSGRLPHPAEVYAALVQTQAKAAELVRSGAIILTGAKTRESVWAFEAAALQQGGGWVAGPGGVEQVTAEELKRRLSQSR